MHSIKFTDGMPHPELARYSPLYIIDLSIYLPEMSLRSRKILASVQS